MVLTQAFLKLLFPEIFFLSFVINIAQQLISNCFGLLNLAKLYAMLYEAIKVVCQQIQHPSLKVFVVIQSRSFLLSIIKSHVLKHLLHYVFFPVFSQLRRHKICFLKYSILQNMHCGICKPLVILLKFSTSIATSR